MKLTSGRPRVRAGGLALAIASAAVVGIALAIAFGLRGATQRSAGDSRVVDSARAPAVTPPSAPLGRAEQRHDLPIHDAGAVDELDRMRVVLSELFEGHGDQDPRLLSEMIECARDPECPIRDRLRAVRWLARFGGDEGFEVIERLLREDANFTVRQAAVAALGECPHPQVDSLLEQLLGEEILIGGVILALEARGDGEAIATILRDARRDAWIRVEAALSLGRLGGASAQKILVEALASTRDDELAVGVVRGLAALGFAQNEELFRSMLSDPQLSEARKLEVLSALEQSHGADAFLLEVATSARSEKLRESAVDSLAWLDGDADIGGSLGRLLAAEPSVHVRAAAYQALASRPHAIVPEDLQALLPSILGEETAVARREAYRMTAILLHHEPNSRLAEIFDESMVWWLRREAEQGSSHYARSMSITALGLADTPASKKALLDLTYSRFDDVAEAAQRTLDRHEQASRS